MAKTETADEFEGIDLDTYTPETTEGKYDRHVRATLARDEELAVKDPDAWASGKRTRVKILVPTGDVRVDDDGQPVSKTDGTPDYPDVAKEVRLFQESARLRDRTARKIGETNQGDGYTALSFILTPKQNRARLTDEERAARTARGESPEPEETDED